MVGWDTGLRRREVSGPGTTAASLLCDTAPVRIKAVIFDLFITLTDWEAERYRPQFMDELAAALGADRRHSPP